MTKIPIEEFLEPCIPPGEVVTLHVPTWKWLANDTNWGWIPIESLWGQKHLVHQGERMHEHIVFKLRYGI